MRSRVWTTASRNGSRLEAGQVRLALVEQRVARLGVGRGQRQVPADVDNAEDRQRAELGFCSTGSDDVSFEALFEKIESEIERTGLAEICARSSDIFHY